MNNSMPVNLDKIEYKYTPTNDLRIWTCGWLPWRYPGNWLSNIKWFFRLIKFSWQRVKYGYCDYDVWDLDTYYANLFHNTLKSLAACTHTYPDDQTPEGWEDELRAAANAFYESIEGNEPQENEYEEESCILREKWTYEDLPDGCSRLITNYTLEDEELQSKWFNREKELAELRSLAKDAGLAFLKARWYSLWD